MTATEFARLGFIAESLERQLPSRLYYPGSHRGQSWRTMLGVDSALAEPTVGAETLREYSGMLSGQQPREPIQLLMEAALILERR